MDLGVLAYRLTASELQIPVNLLGAQQALGTFRFFFFFAFSKLDQVLEIFENVVVFQRFLGFFLAFTRAPA